MADEDWYNFDFDLDLDGYFWTPKGPRDKPPRAPTPTPVVRAPAAPSYTPQRSPRFRDFVTRGVQMPGDSQLLIGGPYGAQASFTIPGLRGPFPRPDTRDTAGGSILAAVITGAIAGGLEVARRYYSDSGLGGYLRKHPGRNISKSGQSPRRATGSEPVDARKPAPVVVPPGTLPAAATRSTATKSSGRTVHAPEAGRRAQPIETPVSYPAGDPRGTWTPAPTATQGQKTATPKSVPKEKAEPAVVTPWAPPGWWQYVKDAIEAIKQEGGGAFENLKGAEGRKPKSATPAKDASKPTVMDAVVSYVPERLTGLNFDMQALAAPGLGPKVRAKECECEKPKKRRKPGCTNKVISRVTRDGIRTTKTRITCPPSKLKSLSR